MIYSIIPTHWIFCASLVNTWVDVTELITPKCRIYASVNQVSIGSDNGLSSIRHQSIIWTNAEKLSIGPLVTNYSEILTKNQHFLFTKMNLKRSSKKRLPFLSRVRCVKWAVDMALSRVARHFFKHRKLCRSKFIFALLVVLDNEFQCFCHKITINILIVKYCCWSYQYCPNFQALLVNMMHPLTHNGCVCMSKWGRFLYNLGLLICNNDVFLLGGGHSSSSFSLILNGWVGLWVGIQSAEEWVADTSGLESWPHHEKTTCHI